MNIQNITIVGAGNGGITAAADFLQRGYDVTLYQHPDHPTNIHHLQKLNQLTLIEGDKETTLPLPKLTMEAKEAIDGADFIMLTVPGDGIPDMARELAPYITEKQPIFINGAASLGALRFTQAAKEEGIDTNFFIGETNSLTYGTRADATSGRVELSLRVKRLYFAAFPKERTEELLAICRLLYDSLVYAKSIWEVTLENGNPEVHPGPSLLNVGRIDYSEGEFWLYKEGITKHTVLLLQAIERERLAIGRALGFSLEDAKTSRIRRGYFDKRAADEDLQTLFNTSEVFSHIKGPIKVNSRYFTEDIRTGLVLWADLGRVTNVPTPNIDAVITLAETILQTDFRENGLTLQSVGIDATSVDELQQWA